MKQYLLSIIRRLRLRRWADGCRFALLFAVKYPSNRAYRRRHPHFVFPPAYYLYETYALDYRAYAEDGLQTAREIMQLAMPWRPPTGREPIVLDWGCGPGRVVRHWAGLLHNRVTVMGADYNESYIHWCQAHLTGIRFLCNQLDPPLAIEPNTVDIIYGLSIFTHLSEKRHHSWAAELYRVLAPGGVLVLTVQGDTSCYKLLPAERERYNRGQLVLRGYQKEGHRLYAAFQPPAFMRQLFGRFTVLRHIIGGQPEGLDGMQDTWLLQKPLT